jgi:hypothetical protein
MSTIVEWFLHGLIRNAEQIHFIERKHPENHPLYPVRPSACGGFYCKSADPIGKGGPISYPDHAGVFQVFLLFEVFTGD